MPETAKKLLFGITGILGGISLLAISFSLGMNSHNRVSIMLYGVAASLSAYITILTIVLLAKSLARGSRK